MTSGTLSGRATSTEGSGDPPQPASAMQNPRPAIHLAIVRTIILLRTANLDYSTAIRFWTRVRRRASRIDPDRPEDNPRATGWVWFEPLEPAAAAEVRTVGPAGLASFMAQRGYWYDALTALEELRAAGGDASKLDAERSKLLDRERIQLDP